VFLKTLSQVSGVTCIEMAISGTPEDIDEKHDYFMGRAILAITDVAAPWIWPDSRRSFLKAPLLVAP